MKSFSSVAILFGLLLVSTLVLAAPESLSKPKISGEDDEAGCHPICRWQCDDPHCPAVCNPICERPRCQIQCEQLPCADCEIHCDEPECTVRCPKDMCEKNDCPKCETVCNRPVCRTVCKAPEPKCAPLCEPTQCDWKCHKPTVCPRPKCELHCEKAKRCASGKTKCCPCDEATLGAAAAQADKNSEKAPDALAPTFMELVHTAKFKASKEGADTMCCPCPPEESQ